MGFLICFFLFHSGDIVALTLTPATLVIDQVPVSAGPLTQVVMNDFNQDTYQDILTLSSDINSLTLISGVDGGVDYIENAMRKIPPDFQIFSILPLIESGVYTGNVLASGWDAIINETYVIQLGKKSDKLDQGYLISSDFIKTQLPDLISESTNVTPEVPEVYIEVMTDENIPLEPQQEQRIITDLGESPTSFIPNPLLLDKKEGRVLREQPRVSILKKL